MNLSQYVAGILERRESPSSPLPIVQAGHPALRDTSRPWSGQLPPEQLRELVDAMVVTMRDAPGVGLAAPQVGIPLRLVVLEDRFAAGPEDGDDAEAGDADDDLLGRTPVPLRVLLDPEYSAEGTTTTFYWEGCLSVSGWQSIVPRHRAVSWRALELLEDGEIVEVAEHWSGWPARIIQHETDHLAGILCHDRAVPRSFVDDRYAPHYADLAEAIDRLGLEGDITRLAPGAVDLD